MLLKRGTGEELITIVSEAGFEWIITLDLNVDYYITLFVLTVCTDTPSTTENLVQTVK